MKNIRIQIFLAFMFFILSPFFFFVSVIAKVFTFPFDKKGAVLHNISGIWSKVALFFLPKCQGVEVIGFEKIDTNNKYVIVANHLSQLDILIGFTLRYPFKWVSKKEVFKVPFIGWGMSLNNFISIDRGSLTAAKKMIKDCSDMLSKGHSIFMFPEGTRSKDGKTGEFKTGAFTIALENKVDILPIVIRNTGKLLPSGTLIMNEPVKVELEILDPISYENFKNKDAKELSTHTRNLISKSL